ncbi:hypothetical protein HQO26_17460 [Rhodococcus fascians]|nr:hypothetical protein [Rhodococcus fascians]MBY4418789.1 hypothetical protein [Rhodococcus fascians]
MTAVARTTVLGRRRTATGAEQFRDPVVRTRFGGLVAVLYVVVLAAAAVTLTVEFGPCGSVERRGARR